MGCCYHIHERCSFVWIWLKGSIGEKTVNKLRKEVTYLLADKSVLFREIGDVTNQIFDAFLQVLPEVENISPLSRPSEYNKAFRDGFTQALSEVKHILNEARNAK